jgi:hypothetical protein
VPVVAPVAEADAYVAFASELVTCCVKKAEEVRLFMLVLSDRRFRLKVLISVDLLELSVCLSCIRTRG